jgi:hypothetical protein
LVSERPTSGFGTPPPGKKGSPIWSFFVMSFSTTMALCGMGLGLMKVTSTVQSFGMVKTALP